MTDTTLIERAKVARLPRPKYESTWEIDPDFLLSVTHDIEKQGWDAEMEVVELAMLAAERDLAPVDAIAAREARDRQVRNEALREAAKAAGAYIETNAGKHERYVAQRAILALIEGETDE